LCHSLNRPLLLYSTLVSQWRYTLVTDKLSAAMQMANRVRSVAKRQNDPALMIGAYAALANTLCYLGDFERSRQHAMRGLRIWKSGGIKFPVEEQMTPSVNCLVYKALSEWFLGKITSSQTSRSESISLAKGLNDMNALACALYFASVSAVFERNPAEAERLASELIELCTRYNFGFWLAGAKMVRGWVRSVSGNLLEGISWLEQGVEDYRATGTLVGLSTWLALKAEALCWADRISEALEAIREAEGLVEKFEVRWWSAELQRLRGLFLTALGSKETEIEAAFRGAINTAKQQKATSLLVRAETTYAEYSRQNINALEGRGIRLPL